MADTTSSTLRGFSLSSTIKPMDHTHDNKEGYHQTLSKYTSFLDGQNALISELLLKGYQGTDKIMDSLQESTNTFIKQLLEELSSVYAKLRSSRSNDSEQMKRLEMQLLQEKEKYEELKNQFYGEWQENSHKSQVIINFLEKELKDNANQASLKNEAFIKKLQHKQEYIEQLEHEKESLTSQVRDLNRILKAEREFANEKHLELKGLEALVLQYQQTFANFETQLHETRAQVEEKNKEITKLEGFNKDLQKQLDVQEAEIQDLRKKSDNEIDFLKKQIDAKENQIKEISQTLFEKNLLAEKLVKEFEDSKDSIRSLQRNQEARDESEKILLGKMKTLEDFGSRMREEVKNIEQKYETKYLLIQRMVSGKLTSLKKDHEKMRKNIHKQMLAFFKLTQMIFINK